MAPDEIAVLVAIALFTVGGFALAHFAKKTRKDDVDKDQK